MTEQPFFLQFWGLTLSPATQDRLAAARSPSGENDTQSFSNTLGPLRYFAKAEATAKAKYERLKKLVEFYNI